MYRLLEDGHCSQLLAYSTDDTSEAAPVFRALAHVCLVIKGVERHVDWAGAASAAALQLQGPTCLERGAQSLLRAVVRRHENAPGATLTFAGSGGGNSLCPVTVAAVTVVAEDGQPPYLLLQGPFLFEVTGVWVDGRAQHHVMQFHDGGSYCGQVQMPVPATVTLVPTPVATDGGSSVPGQQVSVRVKGRGYDVRKVWTVGPSVPAPPTCEEPVTQ